ncbi:diguanylate cyclase [Thermotoga sp. Ku-13t]|uniref:diguanylate cyclase domain-containing protein n=1 Tax=Thermotoga sp. Ku-13t TaxID=1755813 RepID=UPI0013EB138B|nr:diguanylate cyclase [Thermotoga sp. Ku-13t]KAF2958636.1 diguanylate cyclase [Thermotoga sp. Ku-13t]
MQEKEELLKRIKMLEDQLEYYRSREAQMEQLIQEYNELIRRQFDLYDQFVRDIGTSRIIDPYTRVYSADHISKLIAYYHQRAFEENRSYGLILVRLTEKDENFEANLLALAKLLKNTVRVPMDSIGRLSEDTFAVLLTEINKENTRKVIERMKSFIDQQLAIPVKISFRCYPEDTSNLEEMMKEMYEEVS